MGTKLKRKIWGVVAAAAVVGLLAGCSTKTASQADLRDNNQVTPIIIEVDTTLTLAAADPLENAGPSAPSQTACLTAGR